jgi:hypothetical protein
VSEIGVLDPGEYRVTVTSEGTVQDSKTCSVGPSPAETVLIEVGNGLVSVSEGLYD